VSEPVEDNENFRNHWHDLPWSGVAPTGLRYQWRGRNLFARQFADADPNDFFCARVAVDDAAFAVALRPRFFGSDEVERIRRGEGILYALRGIQLSDLYEAYWRGANEFRALKTKLSGDTVNLDRCADSYVKLWCMEGQFAAALPPSPPTKEEGP
jgi:hypothetical protein